MFRPKLSAPLNGTPDWAIRVGYFLAWPLVWLLIPFARVVRTYRFEV